jgi:hypothetical protein
MMPRQASNAYATKYPIFLPHRAEFFLFLQREIWIYRKGANPQSRRALAWPKISGSRKDRQTCDKENPEQRMPPQWNQKDL